MPRTALATTPLVANGNITTAAGTAADAANGMEIAVPFGTERILLRVRNTDAAAKTVTVRKGDGEPAFRRDLGDLAVSVPATSGDVLIGPFESARFESANGRKLHVDFSAATGVTIAAYALPKM